MSDANSLPENAIAVTGMALRVPGAATPEQFWRNLRNGVESIATLDDDDLLAEGVTADELADPHYVRALGVLDGAAGFDAAFFGISPREAQLLDPQHRLLLECAWEALEDAGTRRRGTGRIGVFAGVGVSTYLPNNLVPQRPAGRRARRVPDLARQRQGLRCPPGSPTRSTCAAQRQRADGLLDLAGGGAPGGAEPAHRGVRRRARGRCDGHRRASSAATGTSRAASSPPTGTAAPSTPTPPGTVPGSGGGCGRTQAAFGGGCRRRRGARRDPRVGGQQRRRGARWATPRPSVEGQAEVIAEALAVAGVDPATVDVRGGTRHGHPARRPDRGRRAGQRFRRERRPDRARIGEVERRPPRRRRRGHRHDQDDAGDARHGNCLHRCTSAAQPPARPGSAACQRGAGAVGRRDPAGPA